jgi:probable HAF family extracellular repeat protein
VARPVWTRTLSGAAGLAGLLGIFVATAAAANGGKPVLIELPPETLAVDVAANGFVVAATAYSGGGLYWMPTVGTQVIGGSQTSAISLDGKVIAGNAFDGRRLENAAIWQGGREWRLLGSIVPNAQPCDFLLSSAYGANDDGSVIVGLAWNGCAVARAFRWEEATGMRDLGTLTGESTRANAVSGNGRVVVGWEEHSTGPRLGAKWVDGRQEMIAGPRGGPVGEAFAANRDGSLILGTNCDYTRITGPPTGWTWTQATGVQCFPVERPPWVVLDRAYSVHMRATSDDGRVMGGAYSFGLESQSLIWLDGQVHFLRDYLRDNGLPNAFEGWVNTGFVNAISPDGRTLVGYGAGPRAFQGYMVVLPERD